MVSDLGGYVVDNADLKEACARRDLVANAGSMLLLWLFPAAMMLLAVCCATGWIVTSIWTLALALMGGACLINARRCGRRHCYFTGPFFLLMGMASLAYGLGWLPLGPHGWRYLGEVLVSGGSALLFGPDWIWGRYRQETDCAAGC